MKKNKEIDPYIAIRILEEILKELKSPKWKEKGLECLVSNIESFKNW